VKNLVCVVSGGNDFEPHFDEREADREHHEDAAFGKVIVAADAHRLPWRHVEFDDVFAERVVRFEPMTAGGDLTPERLAVAQDLGRLVVDKQPHPSILHIVLRVAEDFEGCR
jgi:hypothetical protein